MSMEMNAMNISASNAVSFVYAWAHLDVSWILFFPEHAISETNKELNNFSLFHENQKKKNRVLLLNPSRKTEIY